MAAGMEDGVFGVRKREGDDDSFGLCVVYKGKPTHHLIKPGPDGILTVNNAAYGPFTDIESLITHLGEQNVRGWPVPLSTPLRLREKKASTKGSKRLKKASGSTGSQESLASQSSLTASAKLPPKWMHPVMTKEEANDFLKASKNGLADGTFFVRPHSESDKKYIITVAFQGKPTQHLVKKNKSTGFMEVNSKPAGEEKNIKGLIKVR